MRVRGLGESDWEFGSKSQPELPRVWGWRLGTVHSGEAVSTTAVTNITGAFCGREREAALLPCRTIHLGFPLMQWLLLQAVPFLRTASPAATAPGEGRLMTSTSKGSTVQSAELAGMEGTA